MVTLYIFRVNMGIFIFWTIYVYFLYFQAVYKYLYENLTPRDLQDVTHQYPMIFVPQDLGRDQHIPTKGRFLGRHEVRLISKPLILWRLYKKIMQ